MDLCGISARASSYAMESSYNVISERKGIFENCLNSKSKAVEQIDESDISSDRKVVGITTFPAGKGVKIGVIAYEPPESTREDPIIQMGYTDMSGEKKIYNIHVNEVDPEDASDLEMFAYLTYKGLTGEKIPNALNNYDAYSRIKDYDGDYYRHDYINGESRFIGEKVNAKELLDRVHAWISQIQHPDAQMTARWCEWLQNLFEK